MQTTSFNKRILASFAFVVFLLFQFNNCSPIHSQMAGVPSIANSSTADTSGSYVLQCLSSSDGIRVSTALSQSLNPSGSTSNKISSLDWNQDVDLIVVIDNQCLTEHGDSDPILRYIEPAELNKRLTKSVYVIKKESVQHLQSFLQDALSSECLISANKNYEVKVSASTDTYISRQTHLVASSVNPLGISALPATIDTILAYVDGGPNTAGKKVKVAVIDTGIDTTNPDLSPVIARNTDGSFKGYNTTTSSSLGYLQDSGYHGTHVSGLIAAQYNNNYGVTGVYGRNVELFPFRVSNNGDTMTISAIVNAIQIAVQTEHVDIINMSFSTTTDYTELRQAINDALAAGVTIVVAAGNGDSNGVGQTLGSGITGYPAMYSSANNGLITVGSVDLKSRTISKFSNKSTQYVDILAPGSDGDIYTSTTDNRDGIFSTIPLSYNGSTGVGSIVKISDTETDTINGTSMAAPLVTGSLAAVISMAKSHNYAVTNTQLKTWLRGSGSPKSSSFTNYSVAGSYLNLLTLYNYAIGQFAYMTPVTTPSPNPTPSPNTTASGNLTITTQPLNRQVVIDEQVTLSVGTSSSLATTYQWYKDGAAIAGATGGSYKISKASASDAGSYRVLIQSGTQSLYSQSVNMMVGLAYCQN